jgi:hypothetical protein
MEDDRNKVKIFVGTVREVRGNGRFCRALTSAIAKCARVASAVFDLSVEAAFFV